MHVCVRSAPCQLEFNFEPLCRGVGTRLASGDRGTRPPGGGNNQIPPGISPHTDSVWGEIRMGFRLAASRPHELYFSCPRIVHTEEDEHRSGQEDTGHNVFHNTVLELFPQVVFPLLSGLEHLICTGRVNTRIIFLYAAWMKFTYVNVP